MKVMNKVKKKIMYYMHQLHVFDCLNDEQYLKLMFWWTLGKKLDLENPLTFNEKLQWLKLYDRKPEYVQMVDKIEAKKFIASRIGEKYIIPTLGVWNKFEDINFEELPNQFVLKCSHDSGGLVVCKDKKSLNTKKMKKRIQGSLQRNYYARGREWPYKNVVPRILAEKYLEDSENDALTDYKFFCFNGIAKIMYISKDHGISPKTDFFDMSFNHLSIKARDPNSEVLPQKPEQFDEMKRLAEILSEEIPHLRVDFYLVDGRVYVGELTFFHMSGFTEIKPSEWNRQMGEWITLPQRVKN